MVVIAFEPCEWSQFLQLEPQTVVFFLCTLCKKSMSREKDPQCLKIAQKVAFNIASEASYVYILSGQKFVKNAKNGSDWQVFENLKFTA